MAKRNSRKTRKVRNLIFTCTLIAILLVASTYAWFIGMKTVKVNEFTVDIATTEGLFLSMDGKNWSYNLDAAKAKAYENNANQWLDDKDSVLSNGLIPVSTVGDMDKTSSRMKIFEKGSMTSTDGGYKLLTSQVKNNVNKNTVSNEFIEGDGYVAFDLFIKNMSGTEYYSQNNPLNEEAIYLNTDSQVTIGAVGGGKEHSGIENSVRVAFAQIGRVIATTDDQNKITSMNCTGTSPDALTKDGVTGICRQAQIWEPNDTKHVQNAINWYTKSCKKRNVSGPDDPKFNYAQDGSCTAVADGAYSKTYAISKELGIPDYVDIYDGADYNTHTANTIDYATYNNGVYDKKDAKLVEMDTFTDTEKNVPNNGNKRIPFMTLAPNSITKVRVYVYIEGQDVDNYDFAQLGLSVKVNFGFTKERYKTDDMGGYDGPELVTGSDAQTPPVRTTEPVPDVTDTTKRP